MTTGTYAVVWIDQDEARMIYFIAGEAVRQVSSDEVGRHHRARTTNAQERRATDDHVFYQRIANDLVSLHKFLVVGPAEAKTKFVKHLHRFDPHLMARLSAIESMDSLTDGELLAMAHAHFRPALPPLAQLSTFRSI